MKDELKMMEQFTNYLQQRKYYPTTIKRSIAQVNKFAAWLNIHYQWRLEEMENVQYKHLLDYVQHEKARGMSVRTLHISIGSISQYFDYLRHENIVSNNPARTLQIKGAAKTVTENPLKYEELEKLYHGYKDLKKEPFNEKANMPKHIQQKSILTHERNIVITGLLVWQALTSGELERLSVEDINLTEGIIQVPGSAKSNSRKLPLNPQQILPLYSYIHGGTREKLKALPVAGSPSGYREAEGYPNALLIGRMYGAVKLLMNELRGIHPGLKNAQHIRASVILYWLKQYGKRQVQYMAGHRYIDSTEKYAVQQMETLTDQLTKHHPFG